MRTPTALGPQLALAYAIPDQHTPTTRHTDYRYTPHRADIDELLQDDMIDRLAHPIVFLGGRLTVAWIPLIKQRGPLNDSRPRRFNISPVRRIARDFPITGPLWESENPQVHQISAVLKSH